MFNIGDLKLALSSVCDGYGCDSSWIYAAESLPRWIISLTPAFQKASISVYSIVCGYWSRDFTVHIGQPEVNVER